MILMTIFFFAMSVQAESNTIAFDDMRVDREAISAEPGVSGAVKLKVQLWEDGVLPIEFPKGLSESKKKLFFDTCAIWSTAANVRCVEGAYKGRVVQLTQARLGCWALWGMGTHFLVARRRMNLASECWTQATILHELGHAFGLIHEHQRFDRDLFISVNEQNADGSFFGLNTIINLDHQGSTPLTSYDFLSIMHYSRYAFSKNGKETIEPRPGYEAFADIMGRQSTISDGDRFAINALYGAP